MKNHHHTFETEDQIEKGIELGLNIDWDDISKYVPLSYKFMEKHAVHLNWKLVSKYQSLNLNQIEKLKNVLNFNQLVKRKDFSKKEIEKIISKYEDKLNKDIVVKNCKLSLTYLKTHKDSINWTLVCKYQNLTKRRLPLGDFVNYVNWDEPVVYKNIKESQIPLVEKYVNWDLVSAKSDLSLAFIKAYEDKLNLDIIIANQKIDFDFILHVIERIDLTELFENQTFKEEQLTVFMKIAKELKKEAPYTISFLSTVKKEDPDKLEYLKRNLIESKLKMLIANRQPISETFRQKYLPNELAEEERIVKKIFYVNKFNKINKIVVVKNLEGKILLNGEVLNKEEFFKNLKKNNPQLFYRLKRKLFIKKEDVKKIEDKKLNRTDYTVLGFIFLTLSSVGLFLALN